MMPVARMVIESPNDTSFGCSASTVARITSNASSGVFTVTTSKWWRLSAAAHRAIASSAAGACIVSVRPFCGSVSAASIFFGVCSMGLSF